jgi:hypothetical protein
MRVVILTPRQRFSNLAIHLFLETSVRAEAKLLQQKIGQCGVSANRFG